VRSISAIFNDKNDLLAVKTMEVHHGSFVVLNLRDYKIEYINTDFFGLE
jgi:hypothetical protein